MEALNQRHAAEVRFHERRNGRDRGLIWYRMGILRPVHDYAISLLGNVRGKTLVELGCGGGEHAIQFAEQGAQVYASDLSPEMVQTARERARDRGMQDLLHVEQMAAEHLRYPEGFADCVFGGAILHHTELALSRREVQRVLRPGGTAVFIETLGHNPLISLFRRLTPGHRTPTEKPLRFSDIRYFAEPFAALVHKEFYLAALVSLAMLPLQNSALFWSTMRPLARLDEFLFRICPAAGRYAWVTVLRVVK